MKSLAYVVDTPVSLRSAPDLFCLDLYKDFDIDSLGALAAPVKVAQLSGPAPIPVEKTKAY
jgi:hypothetical protein